MYSNHELISQEKNDTIQSQKALVQKKHDPELAPSLHFLLYGINAPDNLQQSSHILARSLCGDLYHLDVLLHQSKPKELIDSFGLDNTLWLEHLVLEESILKKLISNESRVLSLEFLENFVQSAYENVNSKIDKGKTSTLCAKYLFTCAIIGRVVFELCSKHMAEGAFLYGFWLATLPYHANTELDVTLEPRQSRKAFDKVFGKNSTPAFLFHSFYYSDAGNTTFAALEHIHRRSGFYWMRLAKNLALDAYPKPEDLDHAFSIQNANQLIPLEYYHRHFLDDANSEGNLVHTLFPTRNPWWDSVNYLFSIELPAEFPSSLKSYQLSVYFKLLMSDPHLTPSARKEYLDNVEAFSDPRFEWVKNSSLLPLSRWTREISRFHKKPFALELHHMFYPLIIQNASGKLGLIKKEILHYVRDGKIGTIKINSEESPAYVASLMLRNLELQAFSASNEEQVLIKAHLEPLYRRLDTLLDVEEQYQSSRKQNFEEALGRYIESFNSTGLLSNTTKMKPRKEFRKAGQEMEFADAKKSSLSKILYSLAFDSNVLELISYACPASTWAILATIAIAKGISSGSIEDIAKEVMEFAFLDEETKEKILESAEFIDMTTEWFEKNSKWLKNFPYAAELLKFYNQCTTWSKDKNYKLSSSINGMAYLNDMLNSVSPGSSMAMCGVVTEALHNHYLPATQKLSYKSQQVFADAIAHAMLGGLVVRHKLKKSSSIGKGSDKLYDILQECIKIHGKNILALAPPLLNRDGSTITANQIVNSSNLSVGQKPMHVGIKQFGIFKPNDNHTIHQNPAARPFVT